MNKTATESSTRKQVAIKGMHCASCSTRIERVLSSMDGIRKAAVNLAAETMDVEWNPEVTDLDRIAARVSDLGFELIKPTNEARLEVAIKGMTCASCAARIEKVVGALPGVVDVQVNLATEAGVIRYLEGEVSQRLIREAIDKLGFEAKVHFAGGGSLMARQQEEIFLRLAWMRRELIPSFVFAALLLFLSMGEMIGISLPFFLHPRKAPLAFGLVQFFLLLPILWTGRRFYLVGVPSLFRGTPNMDSLIAMGTGAAFVYSTWNLIEIFFGVDPIAKAGDLYFESAGVLIALVSLGKYLESRSKAKTADAIGALMQLTPDRATLIKKDQRGLEEQIEILVEEIEVGDMILLRPGTRIPVDGVVLKGRSSVDESMLTGESLPISKAPGDKIIAGTLNKNSVLWFQAERVGQDTVLARIIRLVQEAQGTKAPIANLADRISLYFVPTVITIASLSGLAWYFIGATDFSFALRIFIAVLVIACPCAMGLATPTSIMVGTGRGAQLGVLIKSGESLEMAERIQVIIFDKTGTLTYGRPALTDLIILSGQSRQENIENRQQLSEDEVLTLLAGAERVSEHPLAEAIVRTAAERGLHSPEPESFEAISGRGIRARVNGHDLLFGSRNFLEESSVREIEQAEISSAVASLSRKGKTVLFLALDTKLTALVAVADQIKPEAKETIARLRQLGLTKLIMLTGDSETTAKAIAEEAGITEIIAQVMPEHKADKVAELQKKGLVVAMVGDGINDAPALAKADVGIAMGTGIDVAIESGDIVLMKGDLKGVLTALTLSRATMRNIKQNLFWAFAYNIIGIPVAAGLLYVFGGPTLNPMIAGGAMALSSVSVVTNALRLRYFKPG